MRSLKQVIESYGIGDIESIKRIKRNDFSSPGSGSSSSIVKHVINAERGQFLHKRYVDESQIPNNRDFLAQLGVVDFPCQHILDKEPHFIGKDPCLIFTYINGICKSKFEKNDYIKIADTLNRFHTESLKYNGNNYIIHGDLHQGNIIFGKEGPSFIDLDDVKQGDPIYDIASLCFYTFAFNHHKGDVEERTNDALSNIMRGYSQQKRVYRFYERLDHNLNKIVELSQKETEYELKKNLISIEKKKDRDQLYQKINNHHFPDVFCN